jgi:hypothetical protein
MSRGAASRVVLLLGCVWVAGTAVPGAQPPGTSARALAALDWPPVTQTAKPWTRWWWLGSSVTPAELTAAMEAYREAGLGGLELTPIYGVRGAEDRFVPFLSREWMALLDHTMREAQRLGLGLDMATGTGWPFGGPWVTRDEACRTLVVRKFRVAAGERVPPVAVTQDPIVRAVGQLTYDLRGSILGPPQDDGKPQPAAPPAAPAPGRAITIGDLVDPVSANRNLQALALDQVRFPRPLPLQALMAYSEAGEVVDLTGQVRADGTVGWVAPAGAWNVYALFLGWHGKLVERAAPGGEGDVIDHFSAHAIRTYLSAFDRAFAGHDVSPIRAFFNDSYEVDDASGQADWTARLFDEFLARRGYDLRRYVPALLGEDTPDRNARVLTDYRETVSDLVLETFTAEWRAWAAGKQALIRNQAHGSPANILDLYAASDIPETEGTDLLRIKFASSAAHVSGKRLASAEAATWLDDHFLSSLADVRQALDRYFLGGINHVVYHGTAYSPRDAAWPGWLFYAAVHFQPTNPMWRDFRALNDYVTRVQGFLQQGQPDADVLLYFPFHDFLGVRGKGLLAHFDGGGALMAGSSFRAVSEALQARGYAFDYVSDRQVATLTPSPDGITASGARYMAVVVPEVGVIPLETAERLIALARGGVTILLVGRASGDVAGLGRLEQRRAAFASLAASLTWADTGNGLREARVGDGRIVAGGPLESLLDRAGVSREPMVDHGLQFVRRADAAGTTYFIANRGERAVDGWIRIARSGSAAALFDPMHARRGRAAMRSASEGGRQVYLQLAPGESRVLRVLADPASLDPSGTGPTDEVLAPNRPAGPPREITGAWRIEFVDGGPTLPSPVTVDAPRSWTEVGGEAVRAFSGTARYTVRFPRPEAEADAWRLDLGRVHETARVRLNGRDLGTLIGPGHTLTIVRPQWAADNRLEVEVSNLMANRIADMDRRGLPWKIFYNVNMPASRPENRGPGGLFDASRWEPRPSGLIGPVTLTPLAPAGGN